MQGLMFLIPIVGVVAACIALGVNRASYYRAQKPKSEPMPRPRSSRALTDEERAHVLATLDSEAFMDMAPAQVYAKLLEDGEYLCSTRTMYRVLDDADQVRERRAQRRHPEYKKPQLVATAPNQVWSWDTTKLSGPTKGTYFTLYVIIDVIIDIFSRYIVGWNVTNRESAAVAQELIAACCADQDVVPEQLTVHADRGSPMVAKSTAQLYIDLGIAKSHSRPHTSNDNRYSEANFRTVKYRPEMPEQLGSLEHARQVARSIIDWYNDEHYHTGLALLHPVDVHYGRADAIVAARQRVLDDAHRRHPERFVRGLPTQKAPPAVAWINPPPVEAIAGADPRPTHRSARRGCSSLNSRKAVLAIENTAAGVLCPVQTARDDCFSLDDAALRAAIGTAPQARGRLILDPGDALLQVFDEGINALIARGWRDTSDFEQFAQRILRARELLEAMSEVMIRVIRHSLEIESFTERAAGLGSRAVTTLWRFAHATAVQRLQAALERVGAPHPWGSRATTPPIGYSEDLVALWALDEPPERELTLLDFIGHSKDDLTSVWLPRRCLHVSGPPGGKPDEALDINDWVTMILPQLASRMGGRIGQSWDGSLLEQQGWHLSDYHQSGVA